MVRGPLAIALDEGREQGAHDVGILAGGLVYLDRTDRAHGAQQAAMGGYRVGGRQIFGEKPGGCVLPAQGAWQRGQRCLTGCHDPTDGFVVGGEQQGVAVGEIAVDGSDRQAGFRRDTRRGHRFRPFVGDDRLDRPDQRRARPHRPVLARKDCGVPRLVHA